MVVSGLHNVRARGLGAFGATLMLAVFASVAVAQQPLPTPRPATAPPPVAGPPPVVEARPVAPAAIQQVQSIEPVAPAAAPAPLLPTPPEVVSAIGRFIDQSISTVGAGMKGAGETLGTTTNAAGDIARGVGDAATTIARLPATNVVSGFERCAIAPNGAPDCEVASVALCKTKGFERGRSLDITSSHKCPAKVWLEGRQPTEAECKQESFVSRAVCQ